MTVPRAHGIQPEPGPGPEPARTDRDCGRGSCRRAGPGQPAGRRAAAAARAALSASDRRTVPQPCQ
jgi:hypothetical protein